MKLKRIFALSLSLLLLSGTALAAETTEVNELNPMNPGPAQLPQFEVTARNNDHSVRVWGTARKQGESSIYLENSNPNDPYGKIVLHISEDTAILDAVSGEEKAYADLRDGESLYAWTSPAMTRSIPPQSTAYVVVCNIPADFGAPTYAQVQSVNPREDGGIDVLMSGDIILHLNGETELLSAPGFPDEAATLAHITPGTMLLSWYRQVALSMPAQAWPNKVMVFPSAYAGYVKAAPGALEVNGQPVELSYKEGPYVHEGKLMLPLRKFAEALGYTVLWDAKTPDTVTLEKDGAPFATLTVGGEKLETADLSFTLSVPVTANSGTTFLCIDDLFGPFRVKHVPQSIFFR